MQNTPQLYGKNLCVRVDGCEVCVQTWSNLVKVKLDLR